MHMADALISPAVGGWCWIAITALILWCSRVLRVRVDERCIPLMGVLGAFVFVAQMVNFAIPGTGASGHLGGGLLLSILLGPHAAFMVMFSVLTVQALFFADGGLLALSCNVLNLGFFTCFVAYPLVYRRIMISSAGRQFMAVLVAAVIGLQLGAVGVVFETTCSGIAALPFVSFLLCMQSIHLAIGVVEGLATAAVVTAVRYFRPDLLETVLTSNALFIPLGRLCMGLAIIVFVGLLPWFASVAPDGLDWSMRQISGKGTLEASGPVHTFLADIQKKLAILNDYNMPSAVTEDHDVAIAEKKSELWLMVKVGNSLAGLIGGAVTLALVLCIAWLLHTRRAMG